MGPTRPRAALNACSNEWRALGSGLLCRTGCSKAGPRIGCAQRGNAGRVAGLSLRASWEGVSGHRLVCGGHGAGSGPACPGQVPGGRSSALSSSEEAGVALAAQAGTKITSRRSGNLEMDHRQDRRHSQAGRAHDRARARATAEDLHTRTGGRDLRAAVLPHRQPGGQGHRPAPSRLAFSLTCLVLTGRYPGQAKGMRKVIAVAIEQRHAAAARAAPVRTVDDSIY